MSDKLWLDDDDIASNESANRSFDAVLEARLSRRDVLKWGLAGIAAGGLGLGSAQAAVAKPASAFAELAHGYDDNLNVAQGFETQIVMRWGDAVLPGASAFNPNKHTAGDQAAQFGYNNDFIGFMPLPLGSDNSEHGLLCVNHEYTNHYLMFDGVGKGELAKISDEQLAIEMAAHGHSVVEIKLQDGEWQAVADSAFNRRITTSGTAMRLSGPAAGHKRLQTAADSEGKTVIGTINNCAGGVTPWGTVLIAEENFHAYFSGDASQTTEARNHKRCGLKDKSRFAWARIDERFDVSKHPHEPNRFGWMVELDPYDPSAQPVKRTALGRFKHEGATTVVNKDGRVVVYSGDDQRFDYLYRFVSNGKFDAKNREANRDLLDDGVLSVAKFEDDGSLSWIPLIFGEGPLTPDNDFHSQADVLIETRRAGDLVGATPMDRPEDVETNPVNGAVYLMLTNNSKRTEEQVDAANPRAKNKHGHVLELLPPEGRGRMANHTADTYRWNILLLAGDPQNPEHGAKYHPDVSKDGWLSCPDNCAFDPQGRLWIATDGAPKSGFADGVWVCDVEGTERALTRHVFRAPRGAEVCGPCFTPDGSTLFVAIQHPADEKGSTFAQPSTRWPDFDNQLPPRPSVVAIRRQDGKAVSV